MHTITVYPRIKPSLEDVKAFVRSLPEGEWVTAAKTSRGVVESDDGRVYLDYDDRYHEYLHKHVAEPDRADLTARLGFSPEIAVHIQPSNAYQHSRELARAICDSLVKKWGGGCSES